MPTNINAEDFGLVVEVEYDYSYKANDGRTVAIKQGETYVLVKKSNEDWWQVIDKSQKKPLYVPAAYVKQSNQKQFLLDHPYFKKAHKKLLDANKANADYQQPLESSSEKVILRTKTADGSHVGGMDSASKWSDLRASTASLDQFIENENPYDIVPYSVDGPFDKEQEDTFDQDHQMDQISPTVSQSNSFKLQKSNYSSPGHSPSSSAVVYPPVRWSKDTNQYGETVMVNNFTGESWIQLHDSASNNYYYFNEISKETVWDLPFSGENDENLNDFSYRLGADLPESPIRSVDPFSAGDVRHHTDDNDLDRFSPREKAIPLTISKSRSLPKDRRKSPPVPPNAKSKPKRHPTAQDNFDRMVTSRTIGMVNSTSPQRAGHDQGEVAIVVMKGKLHFTKVTEAGKKVKKNWLQLWVVLLPNSLVFYKDQKQSIPSKGNPMGKPDSSLELRGSQAQWSKDKSSKKNVLEVSTVTGYSFLLQHDDTDVICDWHRFIEAAIISANDLEPLDRNYLTRKPSRDSSEESMDENHGDVKDKKKKDKQKKDKKGKPQSYGILYSLKFYYYLSEASRHGSDARQSDKVRSKLKKFIGRRPTMESLQERGLIKETVFGCPLAKLCEKESSAVPKFVKMCVEEVERRGLKIDGIYRVSGNLSHVQKLRYQIDREIPVKLDAPEWEDIHVVTGALKLFLRELPEPVVPFKFFDKFISTCKISDRNSRREETKRLVNAMPRANRDTLQYLMQHFTKVVNHSDSNRMQVQNIAIVFGPTLLLKPPEAGHHDGGGMMAVYMMYQNQIIDYMLSEFRGTF